MHSIATNEERCRNCGATVDLTDERVWVGGVGYVFVRECRNLIACWERADTQAAATLSGHTAVAS